MGRRKIEIKAIKDDRNRSVTFLKRKGGLFKKAHELSVLCSVDVAVVIFGANKKLYEFSSGDIQEFIQRHQYYGGAHEHKGPGDFQGKRDGDNSDDDEVDEAALDEQMGAHMPGGPPQQQPGYPPHMRHPAPSASPPVGNGVMGYHPRAHTPQPPVAMGGSRPSSRNMIQRPGSNLGQHPRPPTHGGPQVPNGYTSYLQQQGPYQAPHPQQHGMPVGPHQGQPHPQQYQYSQAPQQPAPPAQMHPQYLNEDQRRMSGPPPYRPDQQRGSTPQPQGPPQNPPPQQAPPPQPRPPPRPSQSPPQQQHQEQRSDLLQVHQPQPKPMTVKSKSIYTPIDDNRSMLAGAWGFGPTDKAETPIKQEPTPTKAGPMSDGSNGARSRHGESAGIPTVSIPPPHSYGQPQRTTSTASLSGEKRPNLKLQIPSEPDSETGGNTGSAIDGTAVASPKPLHGEGGAGGGTGPGGQGGDGGTRRGSGAPGPGGAGGADTSHSGSGGSGVVLPPPSPSASALLSAGAQGPPNPFARPLPPNSGAPGQPPNTSGGAGASAAGNANSSAYGNNNTLETPMSALPSRVLGDQFLPSPSSFYPEWGFGGGNSGGRSAGGMGEGNMLPSPLNWQTPVAGQAPGFPPASADKEEDGRKREREREGGEESDAKRARA